MLHISSIDNLYIHNTCNYDSCNYTYLYQFFDFNAIDELPQDFGMSIIFTLNKTKQKFNLLQACYLKFFHYFLNSRLEV